jgi:DNA uptake protein ComE-like DNA-binding protein
MKKYYVSFLILMMSLKAFSQVPEKQPEPSNSNAEQQLENITETGEDAETEDDTFLQQLAEFQKNPINLNYATEEDLLQLHLLTTLQIKNFIAYRNLLGSLIDIYELQAVPTFSLNTIQKIRPYVTVNIKAELIGSIADRLKNGNHTLLVRASQIIEKSKGFLTDALANKSYYPGSAQKLFVRYRYNYKNLLQYGLVGEKDAGEQFFKGNQKQGFDFYSAHIFARNIGKIKSLAIGDFTVNMGQGLTSWMSLAFKKGPDITAIKREAEVLRPYNAAGEVFFHRGVGITVKHKNIEATLFGSYKKIDANFNAGFDSTQAQDDYVTSFQTSGFHRTNSEYADKGTQQQIAYGGNVKVKLNNLQVGVNAIQYNYKLPLQKSAEPYNLYALSGKNIGNYSTDYAYTYKNVHLFGEFAINDKLYHATINGALISVANNVDMSLVYRNISKGYQSLYTNAFTESATPSNEKGLFTGISLRPSNTWRIDAYADFYKFPWIKYRLNSPSTGSDYLLQFTYKPNKIFELYTRFRSESKSINYNPNDETLSPVIPKPKQTWRTQFTYKINPEFTFRSRAEALWYDKSTATAESGFLIYADVLFKPTLKPYSANVRLQYFETDSYNSRLYAFENDVLYSFSIPVFYEKGYRYYLNLNYDINKKITVWAKFAQYLYPEKNIIGSGLDEISKNHKTEAKLQILYNF